MKALRVNNQKLVKMIIHNLRETKKDFCKNIGISRQTYYNIMNNRANISVFILRKICDYYNENWINYLC